MLRKRLVLLAALAAVSGCAAKPVAHTPLEGAWRLDRMQFVDPDSGQRFYDDMTVYSSGHYLNTQLWRDGSGRVNTHGGEYRTSHDTLYQRALVANEEDLKQNPERGAVYRIEGDTLRIFTRRDGAPYPRSLVWIYARMPEL